MGMGRGIHMYKGIDMGRAWVLGTETETKRKNIFLIFIISKKNYLITKL